MGKPRLIILVRHAQSEGNLNRAIHQVVPDHRVKLTEDGWRQAADAGRRLRKLLRPDDTLQFYTSPYRRTRETTEGILRTLTARHDPEEPDEPPSPFDRSRIKVYEEPRLRGKLGRGVDFLRYLADQIILTEQDWGNFQPCSAEMERMWRERADYGHFFYRIPNGESAADAYDRVSGFNESVWRQFGEDSFPSVCVLVTHGLMTRVFLMKWYHWSVEYFEDLRNINHCEFIIMKQNLDNGKFILQNELRTWSQLKRLKSEHTQSMETITDLQRRNTLSHFLKDRRDGAMRPSQSPTDGQDRSDVEPAIYKPERTSAAKSALLSIMANEQKNNDNNNKALAYRDRSSDTAVEESSSISPKSRSITPNKFAFDRVRFAENDAATPHDAPARKEYFEDKAVVGEPSDVNDEKPTPEQLQRWAVESGLGQGKHADALGDDPGHNDDHGKDDVKSDEDSLDEIEKAEQYDRSFRGSVY